MRLIVVVQAGGDQLHIVFLCNGADEVDQVGGDVFRVLVNGNAMIDCGGGEFGESIH